MFWVVVKISEFYEARSCENCMALLQESLFLENNICLDSKNYSNDSEVNCDDRKIRI